MPVEKKSKLNFWILCFIFFLSGLWLLITHTDSEAPQRSEPSSIEAVKTLPYVAWTPIDRSDIGKTGVVSHDPDRTGKGVNIYYCEAVPGGCLMDMQGKVLHVFSDKRTSKNHTMMASLYLSKMMRFL